jgi:hypothetical protein
MIAGAILASTRTLLLARMRRSSQSLFRSTLVALLLPAFAPQAHAGPALDVWLERARAADSGGGGDLPGLVPWSPLPGIRVGWGEPQSAAWPGIVANEFAARGGVRFQTGDLGQAGRVHARIGVALRGDGSARAVTFEGTSLSLSPGQERGAGEFYASMERRHWGPGWSGSLILDGAAPAVAAVGWRRSTVETSASPWLSWIGPWGADMFIGRLSGHREPARPTLVGMRVQLEPVPGFGVGLSRSIQWGGRGRDESWSSLRNSLLGNDNIGYDGITAENEPGNQLAGIDVHWRVHRASSTSVYAQLVGEDEAGHFPSRNMLLAGVDTRVPLDHGSLRLFAEWSDTLAGRVTDDPRPGASYRHSVYRQGYTHEGVVLGHVAGGDVALGSIGGVYREGAWAAVMTASAGRAEPSAQLFAPGRVKGLSASLRWARDSQGSQLGAQWGWWRDTAQTRHALQLWWQAPLW